MTNISSVSSESLDAVFSSHNIENLYPHEVPVALSEFLRVLKPDGFVVITCPDLQSEYLSLLLTKQELWSRSLGLIRMIIDAITPQ